MPIGPRRVALVLAFAAVPGTAAEAPTAPAAEPALVVAALERPTITGQVEAPAVLRIGRAEIQPAAGAKLLVLSAQGRNCGVVLDGPARLTYRIEDRFSAQVARRNLKHASGLEVTQAGDTLVATTTLKGAAVWGWDLELPAAPSAAVPGVALPKWLLDVLEAKLDGNPGRDLALSLWNSDAGFRWAVLRGADDDFALDVDPRPTVRQEYLMRWQKLPPNRAVHAGLLIGEELVAQPTSGEWWDAPAVEFVTTDTDLHVVNDVGDHVTVRTKLLLKSFRDGLRLLPLSLVRETFDENGHAREMRIATLTADGQPVRYVHTFRGDLLVELPRALGANQTVTLEVVAEGNILMRPGGDNYWLLGIAPTWYPRPAFYGAGQEWSSFRIDAESRTPFVPVAAGEIVTSEKTAGGAHVVTTLKGPMQAAVVVAGKYTTLTEEHEGRRVHVSTYAGAKDDAARRLARNVLSVCGCLEEWLGIPYPFQDLELVEVNEWGWGQAPPGAIFITKEAFLTQGTARMDDETERMASWVSRGVNERIAHEVAHGWFPHVAKVLRAEENWLSESLAEYASAYCLERSMGDRGQAKYFWQRQVSDWGSTRRTRETAPASTSPST